MSKLLHFIVALSTCILLFFILLSITQPENKVSTIQVGNNSQQSTIAVVETVVQPEVKVAKAIPQIGERDPRKPEFYFVRDYFLVNRTYFDTIAIDTYNINGNIITFDVVGRVVYINDIVSKPQQALDLVYN